MSNISVKKNASIIEKLAPLFAVFWLLYAMNSLLAWFSFGVLFRVIGFLGVFLSTFAIKEREVTKGRIWMAFFVFIYYLWAVFKYGHLLAYVSVSMTFFPLICILFWPIELIENFYLLFRKIVLFFAIGSIIITILSFLNLNSLIPHFRMPAQSPLHINHNDYYHVYVLFPQLMNGGIPTLRACGMMEEPGHFSIVLGYIYLIDRYRRSSINPLIIICAIFAFSAAFFLILAFTEIFNFIRYWRKTLLYCVASIILGIAVYQSLPKDIQYTVNYLFYERNLQKVTDVLTASGSLDAALDERTNVYGSALYDRMSFGDKLVGNQYDTNIVLSDYRGFIVSMGLIGLTLVVIISLMSLTGGSFAIKLSLFLTMFLIILHRSWFFYEPFPYLMAFMATALYKQRMTQLCRNR